MLASPFLSRVCAPLPIFLNSSSPAWLALVSRTPHLGAFGPPVSSCSGEYTQILQESMLQMRELSIHETAPRLVACESPDMGLT